MTVPQDNNERQNARERQYRQPLRSYLLRLKIVGLLVLSLIALLVLQLRYLPENHSLNVVLGVGIVAGVVFAYSQSERRAKFVDDFMQTDDVALLPLILESLDLNTPVSKRESVADGEVVWTSLPISPQESACLRRLLPQMGREIADRLTTGQAQRLYSLLKGEMIDNEVRLLLSILDSLLITEDTRALPPLKRLAEEMVSSSDRKREHSPQFHRVRKLVESCLPVLTARLERERSEQTLLRAGMKPDAPARELVRPVLPTNTGNTSDLLLPIAEKEPPEGKRDS